MFGWYRVSDLHKLAEFNNLMSFRVLHRVALIFLDQIQWILKKGLLSPKYHSPPYRKLRMNINHVF